jgi:hypothetical protein
MRALELVTNLGSVLVSRMLDKEIKSDLRTKVISNVDFKAGSSKHGNAFLASVGDITVVAMYLDIKYIHISPQPESIITYSYHCSNTQESAFITYYCWNTIQSDRILLAN